jgi:hypothetical protein
MAFREKSAWIMSVALLVAGAIYFNSVVSIWQQTGQLAQPMVPLLFGYVIAIVVISILSHIALAIFAPRDANAPADERERQIIIRSGYYSSYVLATGLLLALGLYLALRNGDLLFYIVFLSLMLAQLVEYALTIIFYRTA